MNEMPEHEKAIRERMGIKSGLSLNRFMGENEGKIDALQSMLMLIEISGGTCNIDYYGEQLENSPETIRKLKEELEEKLTLQAEFEERKKNNPVKMVLEEYMKEAEAKKKAEAKNKKEVEEKKKKKDSESGGGA